MSSRSVRPRSRRLTEADAEDRLFREIIDRLVDGSPRRGLVTLEAGVLRPDVVRVPMPVRHRGSVRRPSAVVPG